MSKKIEIVAKFIFEAEDETSEKSSADIFWNYLQNMKEQFNNDSWYSNPEPYLEEAEILTVNNQTYEFKE